MLAPVISTKRLVLRLPRPADDGAMLALLNDPAIARMTARVPHPMTLADIAGRRRLNKGGGEKMYAVERDGELIGGAGIKLLGSGEPPRIMPRLGYWIGAPYQGNGFGTEAVGALVRVCFKSADCDVVGAGVFADNRASVRMLEKCGFEPVGRYMTFSAAREIQVDTIDFNLTAARYRTIIHD